LIIGDEMMNIFGDLLNEAYLLEIG
jgi:hypothetical protein